ncbi:MAG: flagellar biosynthetic protein FliO [Verrucomicrobiota bacterium]|jgi:flagellar protein FliO/FliZ
MMRRPHRAAALFALCLPGWAVAAADADRIIYPASSAAATAGAQGLAGGNALTVVAFLLLAGAGAWVLWRGRNKPAPGRETQRLTVAESRSLGSRQYLVVASYDGKKFLLGVCPGRIDLLAPLDGTGDVNKLP